MGEEREEVFERIPWETLEKPPRDHNWLVMALAGAVAVGALAYSLTRNQPQQPMAEPAVSSTGILTTDPPPGSIGTVASPLVVAEADLYAVDEERLLDEVMAHAEWFVVEYFSYDGSDASRLTLTSLLPEGIPLPEAAEGTQVFVDWVGAGPATEISPLVYQVGVMVRSLVSGPDGGFTRQPPIRVVVEVRVDPEGRASITRPPIIEPAPVSSPDPMVLTPLPDQLRAEVEAAHGPVIGGEQLADGGWRVVVMVSDADGVTRPRTITVP
jgi:hypothetical protein